MHFSIVKINPLDAAPSHGFDDAIFPLYYALQALGYEVEILFNRFNPKSRNIVFGSCIAPRRTGRSMPKGSIIFNLEQLNFENKFCNPDYLAHLHDFTVWDYSSANIEFLQSLGVADFSLVPLGYVPQMSRLPQNNARSIDTLFYGLLTERRHELIMQLAGSENLTDNTKLSANITQRTESFPENFLGNPPEKLANENVPGKNISNNKRADTKLSDKQSPCKKLNVIATQDAFGALRDKLLTEAKTVLNVHAHFPARLEVVRLGYVWANKRAVVSECREDTEVPEHLQESCLFVSYDEIPEALSRLCADAKLWQAQAEKGFKVFSAKPMTVELAKIVGRRSGKQVAGELVGTGTKCSEWLITGENYHIFRAFS